MKISSKELVQKITAGENVIGLFMVPETYVCAGFVEGTRGTMKIWGNMTMVGLKPENQKFCAEIFY